MWLAVSVLFVAITVIDIEKIKLKFQKKKEKERKFKLVPVKGKKYLYMKHAKYGYLYKKSVPVTDSRYHAEVLFRNGGIDKNLFFDKKRRAKLRVLPKKGKKIIKFYDGTFLCKKGNTFYSSEDLQNIYYFNYF